MWGRGGGREGPFQAGQRGTSGIVSWALPQGRGGRKEAADGSPRGFRDPPRDPGTPAPTLRPRGAGGGGGGAREVTASPPRQPAASEPRPGPAPRGQRAIREAAAPGPFAPSRGRRGRDAGPSEGLPGPRSRYLRRSEVLAAPSGPRSPGPRGARRALATRARVPRGALVAAARSGVPGREVGSSSRGRAACCGGLAWRPGASPDPIRLLSGRPGDGATPPSWQGLSHRDAPAPGLGHCCILTSIGSPGPGAGPRPPPRVGCRVRGAHCLHPAPSQPVPRDPKLRIRPGPQPYCLKSPA